MREFEALVKRGEISSFWVSVGKGALVIQASNEARTHRLLLSEDMSSSLSTFFYDVEKITYRTHDYSNLKCFINARLMLDRMLQKDK